MNKIQKEIKELRDKLDSLENSLKNEKFDECNGLMWSNSIGEGLTWNKAHEFAKECRDGGFSDWRLPTISELQNVFDYEKGEPKIKGWGDASPFWSSTEVSNNPANAWNENLYYGNANTNTKVTATHYVRCVRRD